MKGFFWGFLVLCFFRVFVFSSKPGGSREKQAGGETAEIEQTRRSDRRRKEIPRDRADWGGSIPRDRADWGESIPRDRADWGESIPRDRADWGESIPRDRADWGGSIPRDRAADIMQAKRSRRCGKPVERRCIHGEADGRGEEKGRRGETKKRHCRSSTQGGQKTSSLC
jgi:hypothetical protein